jgi:hypothetical protein
MYPSGALVRQWCATDHTAPTGGKNMTRNMGTADRLLRAFVVAPAAIIAAILIGPGSIGGIILFVVAGVMLVTAAVGVCPLYRVFGMTTCPVEPAAKDRASAAR